MTTRRRLILGTCALGLVFAAGAAILVLRARPAAEAYTAGEAVEGLTSKLARGLPADSPDLEFQDATASAGITFTHFRGRRSTQLPEDMGSGAAWGDIDGDGDDDLFLANFSGPLREDGSVADDGATHGLFRNRGDGTFEDVSLEAGLALPGTAMAAAFGDIDGDWDLDLVVTQFGHSRLFENDGTGRFSDISEASGIGGPEGFWAGASWADYDRDGDLDLHVCGYVRYRVTSEDRGRASASPQGTIPLTLNPSSFPPERNLLFRNDGKGHFEEVAAAAGIENLAGRSLSASWADLDEDGWPDLYVANDVSDNVLYMNRGDGTFEDVSHAAWVADYRGAMGIAIADFDGDLDLDMFITHWVAQENGLYTSLLKDLQGKFVGPAAVRFRDVADEQGLGQIALPMVGWGTEFVDFDNDGRVDLYVANGSSFEQRDDPARLIAMRDFVFWNAGGKRGFFDIAAGSEALRTPHASRGAAFADADGDGDVDLLVMNHGEAPTFLRNQGGNGSAWLEVRLRGTRSNTHGVGARIEVETPAGRQLRLAGGSSSYLSQSSLTSHFGLGAASVVDVLEVRWPSGQVDTHRQVPARSLVEALEGGALRVVHGDSGRDAQPAEARTGAFGAVVFEGPAAAGGRAPAGGKEGVRLFWERARRAQSSRERGDFEAAVTDARAALEIQPDHDDTLYWLGNCLLELDRPAEAQRVFEHLIAVNPLSARGHQQLGRVHSTKVPGAPLDLAAAELHFRRALEINPEESGPLVRLGEVEFALGRHAEAFEHLSAAVRLNPRAVSARYLCSYLLALEGRRAEALDALQRAAAALEQEAAPVKGATSEGDTQSHLRVLQQAAARKSLFGPVWDGLRERHDPATLTESELEIEHARVAEFLATLRATP